MALVGETGKALEAIVSEVREINQNIAAIVISTREQSTGLQEINLAVNAMDQGTQQNAAMVEEQTAASHSLASEASALDDLLRQFKLSKGRQAQTSKPAAFSPKPAIAPRPAASSSRITAATDRTRAVASPARALGQTLAKAFSGGKQSPPAPRPRKTGKNSESRLITLSSTKGRCSSIALSSLARRVWRCHASVPRRAGASPGGCGDNRG